MTPREGVSRADVLRVAEAIGKAGKFGAPWHEYDQNDQRGLIEMAEAAIAAHPAATAREEAIRAEVIEECARVCEEQRCRWCRDAGATNPNHADCCACRDDAAAIRALALARSTGGT